jgi:hypothetical protein
MLSWCDGEQVRPPYHERLPGRVIMPASHTLQDLPNAALQEAPSPITPSCGSVTATGNRRRDSDRQMTKPPGLDCRGIASHSDGFIFHDFCGLMRTFCIVSARLSARRRLFQNARLPYLAYASTTPRSMAPARFVPSSRQPCDAPYEYLRGGV